MPNQPSKKSSQPNIGKLEITTRKEDNARELTQKIGKTENELPPSRNTRWSFKFLKDLCMGASKRAYLKVI